jgi:long-subunit acyl-CoA synthetase (AMP-forming)
MERENPDSDLYEAVVHRHRNPDFAWCRPVFLLFPEKEEWRTRDLFKRCEEPGLENLWHFQGRVDDMMILGNGLKVNPLHIEMRLLSDPNLKGCVVFGENRTKCGLLLEHQDESLSTEDVVQAVWPNVERANALVPEHARIGKELVIVASPGKPFPRAAKGTIVRSLTVKLYEQEIEETYAKVS